MTKLAIIEGSAAPLPIENLDTDQIMPKQFLKGIERTGDGEFRFYECRRREECANAGKDDARVGLERPE